MEVEEEEEDAGEDQSGRARSSLRRKEGRAGERRCGLARMEEGLGGGPSPVVGLEPRC